jgi:hypothetical protein
MRRRKGGVMAKRRKARVEKKQKRYVPRVEKKQKRYVPREAQATGVSTEQLEAILNVLDTLIAHAGRVASKAQVGVVAARDLLVSKAIVTEAEWDVAVDRVEREQAKLFALDPDAQRAVDGIRRLLNRNGGAPDEGGEA